VTDEPKITPIELIPLNHEIHEAEIRREMWPLIEACFMVSGYAPIDVDEFDPQFDFSRITDKAAKQRIKEIYSAAKDSMMRGTLSYQPVLLSGTRDEFRRRRVVPGTFRDWARRRGIESPECLLRPDELEQTRSIRYSEKEVERVLRACDQLERDGEKLTIRKVWKKSGVSREKISSMAKYKRTPQELTDRINK
jgi:hypothetical protein